MLKSIKKESFNYKKLTPEEMSARGILGYLDGPCADIQNETRNGRRYSEELWTKVFESPLVQEQFEAGGIFGELTHPDREEVDMEKIAVIMPEPPTKGEDGLLFGHWDILDTPCGRILKTLCDYGYKVGISTRGSGETFTDYDGTESVDPDSYTLNALDIVLIPAVKAARLDYMTESLGNGKKSLRESLQDIVNNASDADRKVMEETLGKLHLNESAGSDLEDAVRETIEYIKDIIPIEPEHWYGFHSWDEVLENLDYNSADLIETADGLITELDRSIKATERIVKHSKLDPEVDFVLTDDPDYEIEKDLRNELRKAYNKYAKELYPDMDDSYLREANDRLLKPRDFFFANERPGEKEKIAMDAVELQSLSRDEIVEILDKAGNGSTIDNIYDTWWTKKELEKGETPSPTIVKKNIVIKRNYNAPMPTKYYDEEWTVGGSKQHKFDLSKIIRGKSKYYMVNDGPPSVEDVEAHRQMNESLNESASDINRARIELGKALDTWYSKNIAPETVDEAGKAGWDDELQHLYLSFRNSLIPDMDETLEDPDLLEGFEGAENSTSSFDIEDDLEKEAVGDDEALLEELQKALRKNQDLEQEIITLNEKLSVCYAKEDRAKVRTDAFKNSIKKLTQKSSQATALQRKVDTLQESLSKSESNCEKLEKRLEKTRTSSNLLTEQLKKGSDEKATLTKKLLESNSTIQKLEEQIAELTKDLHQIKQNYSAKLEKSNRLVEKYKATTQGVVDKYISSQALKLGVKPEEVKNRLPESYSMSDIDEVCEELQSYKLNLSKLPFTTMPGLREGLQMRANPSKQKDLVSVNTDDLVDEQLMSLMGLK